jgi:predicted nucleic acid-binding protein
VRAIDSTTLSLLIDPSADIPADKKTGKRPEKARERLDHLIETLEAERTKLLIPAPALSEILILAGSEGPTFVDEINSTSVFKVADFNQLAAIEAAAIHTALVKAKTKNISGSKVKTKYDVQIVAIAKVNGAEIIYSEDGDIEKLAEQAGIKMVRISDLPMPPATQPDLFENESESKVKPLEKQRSKSASPEQGAV